MSIFRSFNLFRVRGIPVRVHPALIIFLVIAGFLFSPGAGLAGVLATMTFLGMVFGFVLLHELGHALVAQRLGVQVRSITLHPLGGVASLAMMPRDPKRELQITFAGPAVNFVLAAVFAAAHAVFPIGLLQSEQRVQVRQELVGHSQEEATEQEADGRREPSGTTLYRGELDRWQQQRPDARRHHHAGRESQHRVQQTSVDSTRHEDQTGSQSRDGPGEQACHEGLQNRAELAKPVDHPIIGLQPLRRSPRSVQSWP